MVFARTIGDRPRFNGLYKKRIDLFFPSHPPCLRSDQAGGLFATLGYYRSFIIRIDYEYQFLTKTSDIVDAGIINRGQTPITDLLIAL
jgi:hypothetical protein